MMNVQDIVQKRYSTKSFDASKKISAEDFAQIEAALRYSPSSVNIQPWHFVITDMLKNINKFVFFLQRKASKWMVGLKR